MFIKPSIVLATLFTSLIFCSPYYASEQEAELGSPIPTHALSSEWKHQLMIYGWVAYPSGTVTYEIPDNGEGEPEEVESEFPDKLDFFFMGTYRAEKDKFSVIFDSIYLGMSSTNEITLGRLNPRTIQTAVSLDAWLGSLYGGYNLLSNRWIRLNAVGGLRYLNLTLKEQVNTSGDFLEDHEFSQRFELYDGVVGVDGAVYVSGKWFMPYHLDIGAGSSDLTLRTSMGLGYGFDWGDVLLSYRYLYYDLEASKLIESVQFSGPLVGVNFRF